MLPVHGLIADGATDRHFLPEQQVGYGRLADAAAGHAAQEFLVDGPQHLHIGQHLHPGHELGLLV